MEYHCIEKVQGQEDTKDLPANSQRSHEGVVV
jgi:hypothetical protein